MRNQSCSLRWNTIIATDPTMFDTLIVVKIGQLIMDFSNAIDGGVRGNPDAHISAS
ncbi:MAG TPA: hypothetical protein VMU27_03515 [Candidatus Paceibacterota bacterium]|nr:hypothetical protein [Candidatus Paceibacterota bacterium]